MRIALIILVGLLAITPGQEPSRAAEKSSAGLDDIVGQALSHDKGASLPIVMSARIGDQPSGELLRRAQRSYYLPYFSMSYDFSKGRLPHALRVLSAFQSVPFTGV